MVPSAHRADNLFVPAPLPAKPKVAPVIAARPAPLPIPEPEPVAARAEIEVEAGLDDRIDERVVRQQRELRDGAEINRDRSVMQPHYSY